MAKYLIISLLVVLAVANIRGENGDITDIQNNEITPLQKEGRSIITIPTVATIVWKSLKLVWFLLTKICALIDLKIAALALALKAGIWAYSFKWPVLLGAALTLGFCKVTGICAFKSTLGLVKEDPLDYASDYLDMGTIKYGKSN